MGRNLLLCVGVLVAMLLGGGVLAGESAPPSLDAKQAVLITLAGSVNDYNRDSLMRRYEKARRMGAGTVILEIDTYGGLVTSGMDISRFIKRQTDLHTIAFVKDKAISAGAMIAMACDEIVMAPSATLGDCAPIVFDTGGQLQPLPDAERAKQESPIVKDFLDSARRNSHDPLLAEAMVSVEKVVYCVENDAGDRKFVDEKQYKEMTEGGEWKPAKGISNPVDGPKSLLTVGTDEAVLLGLAKQKIVSAEALASQRGYHIVADLSPSAGDAIVAFLGNPFVRMILITIFLQSLYISLHAPGHGAAEAIAVLSLGMLIGIPLLTGYAQWWEIGLIIGGLALVAFEIFVFPGHLVSAIVGIAMVLFGLIMTFVGDAFALPGSWNMPATWAALEHGLYFVVGALACSFLLSMWLRRYLPSLPYFNRLILTTTSGGTTLLQEASTKIAAPTGAILDSNDQWPFIGTIGRSISELKPGGSAEFPYAGDTRIAAVISESGFVPPGAKILVKEVRGNRVVVRAIT